jgi:hypothetical protein
LHCIKPLQIYLRSEGCMNPGPILISTSLLCLHNMSKF